MATSNSDSSAIPGSGLADKMMRVFNLPLQLELTTNSRANSSSKNSYIASADDRLTGMSGRGGRLAVKQSGQMVDRVEVSRDGLMVGNDVIEN
jgi:hypothetical protein